jgi:hypothetical protein
MDRQPVRAHLVYSAIRQHKGFCRRFMSPLHAVTQYMPFMTGSCLCFLKYSDIIVRRTPCIASRTKINACHINYAELARVYIV